MGNGQSGTAGRPDIREKCSEKNEKKKRKGLEVTKGTRKVKSGMIAVEKASRPTLGTKSPSTK